MTSSNKQKSDLVTFTKWLKNPETNRFQKVVHKETLEILLQYFRQILPEFHKHSFVKRQQADSFEADKAEAEQSNNIVAVLQIDFAENFVCEAQDEIQSAHWNQAAVWYEHFPLLCCPFLFLMLGSIQFRFDWQWTPNGMI